MSKFDEFVAVIQDKKPDFVFITETWLTVNIPDSIVGIPNYMLFRQDRAMNAHGGIQRGGGVGMYVKNAIHGHQVICSWQVLMGNAGQIDSVWVST